MSTTLFNKVINGRHFNFQPMEFGDENGYHIDVKDEQGKRWEFSMIHEEDKPWEFRGQKLPDWITSLQPELEKAINEHE